MRPRVRCQTEAKNARSNSRAPTRVEVGDTSGTSLIDTSLIDTSICQRRARWRPTGAASGNLACACMPGPRRVEGDQVLYPFLQKELVETDLWLSQLVAARLVVALGIWFQPATYQRLPIFLPHVIRDASARKSRGGKEEWGSPSEKGLLRDDNSLIKNAVKSLRIESTRPFFNGARLGGGWVAAHVWQVRKDGTRATIWPETNSFIPNLVWLPSWLARMSDRPASFVQEFLQAISGSLYADVPVNTWRSTWAERAWAQLEIPTIPSSGLPDVGTLNFFEDSSSWRENREHTVHQVVNALQGTDVPGLRPTRYREGIRALDPAARLALAETLSAYIGDNSSEFDREV